MAGLGRRVFTPGEVLTASNVMNYLQDQTVMNFAGTAARGSAIGTAVSEGMVSYLADSNFIETYSGSEWQTQTSGLVPVIPTSVTVAGGTGSVSSDGLVSFTTSSTYTQGVVVNGCFSAKYSNYKIIFTSTSGPSNAGVYLQLSQSGTPNTSNYLYAVSNASDTTAGSEYELTYLNYLGHATTEITVYQPYNAVHTRLSSEFFYDDASGGTFIYRKTGGTHRNTGLFDGIKFWNPTNMTGTIRVFGIRN